VEGVGLGFDGFEVEEVELEVSFGDDDFFFIEFDVLFKTCLQM
jgi:hypothetical protein